EDTFTLWERQFRGEPIGENVAAEIRQRLLDGELHWKDFALACRNTPSLRKAVAELLREGPDTVVEPVLAQMLRDPDIDIVYLAARELYGSYDGAYYNLLSALGQRVDSPQIGSMLSWLSTFEAGVRGLLELVETAKTEPVQIGSIHALVRIGEKRLLSLIPD